MYIWRAAFTQCIVEVPGVWTDVVAVIQCCAFMQDLLEMQMHCCTHIRLRCPTFQRSPLAELVPISKLLGVVGTNFYRPDTPPVAHLAAKHWWDWCYNVCEYQVEAYLEIIFPLLCFSKCSWHLVPLLFFPCDSALQKWVCQCIVVNNPLLFYQLRMQFRPKMLPLQSPLVNFYHCIADLEINRWYW